MAEGDLTPLLPSVASFRHRPPVLGSSASSMTAALMWHDAVCIMLHEYVLHLRLTAHCGDDARCSTHTMYAHICKLMWHDAVGVISW
jgi:hypothetical protein